MKTINFFRSIVLFSLIATLAACGGSGKTSGNPADNAAAAVCKCLSPLGDILVEANSKGEKGYDDYMKVFQEGMKLMPTIEPCMQQLETEYSKESANKEWVNLVMTKMEDKCPSTMSGIKKFSQLGGMKDMKPEDIKRVLGK